MKAKRRYIYLKICTLVMFVWLTACNNEPHEGEHGLTIALDNSRCPDVPIGAIKLCIYDTGGNLAATYDYADARGIAAAMLPIETGHYTVAVVINADKEITATSTLTALHEWLESAADTDTDLLSGMAETDVASDGITCVTVPLCQSAFTLPTLRLLLTLPGPKLPDYTPATKTRAAEAGYTLRCVAELCKTGTDKAVLRKTVTPEPQPDGTYLVELEATEGNYDLRLWTDYAPAGASLADTYYHTESLQAVTINTEPYTANTDTKDAAYHSEENITLPEEGKTVDVRMERPLAKYRIIANDAETYRKLTAKNPEKYPPMEDLTVKVQYEDFFPSEFNTWNSKVTDATTGIGFSVRLTGSDTEADGLPVAADWIMASGESAVTATLTVSDSSGRQICRVGGVRIAYKQGCMTTIRGKFLTAGINSGGISIDTDWNEIIIDF